MRDAAAARIHGTARIDTALHPGHPRPPGWWPIDITPGSRHDPAIGESPHQDALNRLQKDYLRGAIRGEDYTRLREELLSGSIDPADVPEQTTALHQPPYSGAGVDPATGAPLAGWGRRAAALLLDAVILAISFVPTFIWTASTEDPLTGEISDAAAIVLVLQFFFLPFLYPWLTTGIWGHTLGKLAVGIAVRRGEDAARVGLARAAGRVGSVFLLGIFSLPLLLSYLWPLWDSRNQTLHDKMANTIVVRSK